MVLSGGLPILPLLPEVTILPVFHLLAVVEDNGAILRPEEDRVGLEFCEQNPGPLPPSHTFSPCLWGTG